MVSFDLILFTAIIAGFFGAMTGLGGGTIIVPVLTYLGVDIKLAIAASMISVIATSCTAASLYIRQGLVNLKVGMYLEMFTAIGALIGATITLAASTGPLFIAFGVVLIGAGIALFTRDHVSHRPPGGEYRDRVSRFLGLAAGYEDRAEGRHIWYYPTRPILGGPLMVIAGMISGLLGIGAGAFKVLVQDLVMEMPTKVSTSTSNMIIGITALAGSSVYLAAGLIEPVLVVPIILGVFVGASLGTLVLARTTNRAVRRYFVVVVVLIGVFMIGRGIG